MPVHVVAQIGDPRTNAWRWSEATFPARFGEHPLRAAARLGIVTDLKEDMRSVLIPDDTPTRPAVPSKLPTRIGQMQVAATATNVSPLDMWSSLGTAWVNQFGTAPTYDQLMVLLTQWAFETGNGASMIQYNVGNFKHVDGDGLDWTTYNTQEVINGQTETLPQNFKAWPDLDSGVAYYFSALTPPSGKFASAWPAVLAGDLDQFAYLLKQQGYYTLDEASYASRLDARKAYLESQYDFPDPQVSDAGAVVSSNLPTILLLVAAGAGATWVAYDQGWIPDPVAALGSGVNYVWDGVKGLVS